MLAIPNRLQKANGWSCSSKQLHSRRIDCDCLSTSYRVDYEGVLTAHTLVGCDLTPPTRSQTSEKGIGWFDGQQQAAVNPMLRQHSSKLFTRIPVACFLEVDKTYVNVLGLTPKMSRKFSGE